MPAQLLIINPNTSASVSDTLRTIALREAAGRCEVRVQTARLGASYISDEISFAIAGHALLDAYAFDRAQTHLAAPDAVLIGCFGDPGLLALQQLSHVPVLGLAQASMQAAHARGRYAVITGGLSWVPMLHRLVVQLGLNDRLASIHAVDKTGAQLAADPQAAVRELADRCEQVVAKEGELPTILLGGAALGGMAQAIEARLRERGVRNVKLMDSVASSMQVSIAQAIAHHEQAAANALKTETLPNLASMQTLSLSSELQALLHSPVRI
jgi:allantoin racemase